MPSAQDHEQSIINALMVTDPQIDTGLGTTIRKLISAVALELSGYTTDRDVTQTLYALESVSGAELDYMVGQFGFTRQLANNARGTVTVSRDNADSLFSIDYGTQFYVAATASTNSIFFQSTAYQEMPPGVTSVDVSVVAVNAGAIGNVAANTIRYSAANVGFISCTNMMPTSGGRDAETDDELRRRFLATVFRNESGTREQYLGLALAHASIGRAKMIGQESHYTEITQVENGYVASLVPSKVAAEVRRYYPGKVWVRNTDTGELFNSGEYQFELNTSSGVTTITFLPQSIDEEVGPVSSAATSFQLAYPVFNTNNVTYKRVRNGVQTAISKTGLTISNGNILTANPGVSGAGFAMGDAIIISYTYCRASVGDFVTVEFDYNSKRTRDDLRACELFVDGENPQAARDIQYVDFDKVITTDIANNKYRRADGTKPTVNNLYIPLSHQPVMGSQNRQISVGTSIVLSEGRDFNYIYDITEAEGGTIAADGIELIGSMSNNKFVTQTAALDDESPMSIPYYYNSVPEQVQQLTDSQSVVTMDVCVHQANRRRVGIYLTLMYSTFPRDSIASSVEGAIISWCNNLQFGASVQFSDIETIAANTVGVDNVRVSIEQDAGGARINDGKGHSYVAYGIIEYARDGETIIGQKTGDFLLNENEVLDIQWIQVYARAQSNW